MVFPNACGRSFPGPATVMTEDLAMIRLAHDTGNYLRPVDTMADSGCALIGAPLARSRD